MDTKDEISVFIEDIAGIPIVPRILELVCKTTGLRFSAVARVTDSSWTALAVADNLGFGMKPGDAMQLDDTLCSQVQLYEKPIIIDDVDTDDDYCNHRIPKEFGFRSHVSVPIIRSDGSFFGTLCAIDPEPRLVSDEKAVALFTFLAGLIAEQLDTIDILKTKSRDLDDQLSIARNLESLVQSHTAELKRNVRELARSNKELRDFGYVASHDLQEPLRKIQTFMAYIASSDAGNFSEKGQLYFNKVNHAVDRMRQLIDDLLSYSVVQNVPSNLEQVHLGSIVKEVEELLSEEILSRNARLDVGELCGIEGYPFQLRQLFQNLIGNSLKYASPERAPIIEIKATTVTGHETHPDLEQDKVYCKISVRDNGIGFDQKYAKKIFEVFQRLHGKLEYSGTGIGLAIVRKIVENHNGYIGVRGQEGKGAEFSVFLPLKTSF